MSRVTFADRRRRSSSPSRRGKRDGAPSETPSERRRTATRTRSTGPAARVVHRLPPQCKLVAVLLFVLVVVATPQEQFWAFGVYALLLAAVALVARVPVPADRCGGWWSRCRSSLFARAAAVRRARRHGRGARAVGSASRGLLGAWNILAKGTLGVVASILLAATTEPRALLLGLERLRLPALMVQIMSFMLRYVDVVGGEMHRMRIARESRGFQGARRAPAAGGRAVGRRAVHPLLRARRAGAPRHAQPRVHRHDAAPCTTCAPTARSGRPPPRCRWPPLAVAVAAWAVAA